MQIFYEVIMIDSHCPQETCSMGLFPSREEAEECIQDEKQNYSEHMYFEIEEKYMR